MTSATLVALARPTFDVGAAQRLFDSARATLRDAGASLSGPDKLIMTPEETAEAAAALNQDEKLFILLSASFSDASPAVSLLSHVKGDVLLWSVREFGDVGDRLLLNSMCGSNLAAHALRVNGKKISHIHGNPDEPHIVESLRKALAGELPQADAPTAKSGELAQSEKVESALATLRGNKIGAIGDAPAGFTPCTYDPEVLRRSFGIEVVSRTIPEIFADIAGIPSEAQENEISERLRCPTIATRCSRKASSNQCQYKSGATELD